MTYPFATTAAMAVAFAPLPVSALAVAHPLEPSQMEAPGETAPAQAEPSARPGGSSIEDSGDIEEILVLGSRARGSVVGTIQPVLQLDAADIRAIGSGTLADLLQELAPQLRSGAGRGGEQPIVLINGKRVSGFSEIRNIPPEAIERVDILPEEVALSYGYRPDQRVINFVLQSVFRSVTAEADLGGPMAGGRTEVEVSANILRLSGDNRLILDLEYEHRTRMTESARNILATPSERPFDLRGNIVSAADGQDIDPALSTLAGTVVTIAGVPGSAALSPPPLGAFASSANRPNITDEGDDRTLLPQTRKMSVGASLARPLSDRVQASFSARMDMSDSEDRLGLPSAAIALPAGNPFSPFLYDSQLLRLSEAQGPLLRSGSVWAGRVAALFSGDIAGWNWSLTASHDHNENKTFTDRGLDISAQQARILQGDTALNPFGPQALAGVLIQDRAASNSDVSLLDLVANGRLLNLPAGGLTATLKAGYDRQDLSSEVLRSGEFVRTDLLRDKLRGQASFDVPITSRNRDILSWLGNLSLNLNVALDEISDFGSLTTVGAGLNWVPIAPVQLSASITQEDGAPSIQQLGNPLVATPNVRVFDYGQGQTVEITRLDGGNAVLSADRRRVLRLGANIQPIPETELYLSANYVSSRIDDPIASFPTATAEIEAAFPERFLRDADGRLIQIDNRPVNFLRSEREEVRWGVNFSKRLQPSRAEREAMERRRADAQTREGANAAGGPRTAARPRQGSGGAGGGGGMRRGGPDGRLQFSLFHTWKLEDSILIREGVPELDLLNGSATGSRGGVPKHEIQARAGINKSGLGARLTLNWSSGTEVRVDPAGAESPDDLRFSSLGTINLRLFADLGQQRRLVEAHSWLRGARVSLNVENLFDARLQVRDRADVQPIAFQADLLDPVGRRVEVSFRKIFF